MPETHRSEARGGGGGCQLSTLQKYAPFGLLLSDREEKKKILSVCFCFGPPGKPISCPANKVFQHLIMKEGIIGGLLEKKDGFPW